MAKSDGPMPPALERSGVFAVDDAFDLRGPCDRDTWVQMLPDEVSCRRYLATRRWRGGFRCPVCRSEKMPFRHPDGRVRCAQCNVTCSAATRSLLDGGTWTLHEQLSALYEVASTRRSLAFRPIALALGASSLGVGPWLRRLRRIYREGWRRMLHGTVELTRVTVEVLTSRRSSRRHVLALAVQTDGPDTGRIRVQRLPEVDSTQVISFVERAVGQGTTVFTSTWRGYRPLSGRGFVHQVADPNRPSLGNVEQLAHLLRVWAWRLDAPSVDRFDVQLEDFVFRHGFRLDHAAEDHGTCFSRLVDLAVLDEAIPRSRISSAG